MANDSNYSPQSGVTLMPVNQNVMQSGLTYEQAMEVLERFCSMLQAVPAVADQMCISESTVSGVLDGKVWPQARQYWIDHAVVIA